MLIVVIVKNIILLEIFKENIAYLQQVFYVIKFLEDMIAIQLQDSIVPLLME